MPWVELPSTELRFHPGPPSWNAAPYLSERPCLRRQGNHPASDGPGLRPPDHLSGAEDPAHQPRSGCFLAQPGNPPGKMPGVEGVEHRPRKYREELAGWGRLLPGAPEPASWGKARETHSMDWACPGRPRWWWGECPGSTAPGDLAHLGQTPKQPEPPGACGCRPLLLLPHHPGSTNMPRLARASLRRFLMAQKCCGKLAAEASWASPDPPHLPGSLSVAGPGAPTQPLQPKLTRRRWRRGGSGVPGGPVATPRECFWDRSQGLGSDHCPIMGRPSGPVLSDSHADAVFPLT